MPEHRDECVSCIAFNKGHHCEDVNSDGSCPCMICIVRVMCDEWCYISMQWKERRDRELFPS